MIKAYYGVRGYGKSMAELEMLKQENNQLKEKMKYDKCFIYHLKEDKKELQQKIDKAIEYIKEHTKETNFDNDKLIDILEILGDKE